MKKIHQVNYRAHENMTKPVIGNSRDNKEEFSRYEKKDKPKPS